jgi:hypothetical protein
MSAGAPIPPNPAYRVPPPPPATSGNTVLKIVLIVIGVFVLLGVIGAGVIGFGVYKISKTAHRNADGGVSFSTPGGTITAGNSANISAADLGTALYPGAVSGQGSMNMKLPTESLVTAVYTSSDSPDKIVSFYKEKLGDQASIVQSSNNRTVLTAGDKDKESIMVTVSPEGNTTKFVIMHVTKTHS